MSFRQKLLSSSVALLIVTAVTWLAIGRGRELALQFQTGEKVRIDDARSFGSVGLESVSGPAEIELLQRYQSSATLQDYLALFAPGDPPQLSEQEFGRWKARRDKMQKLVDATYTISTGESSYRLVVFQLIYDGSTLVDAFMAKTDGDRWVPVNQAENQRFRVVKDFFRELTFDGIRALDRRYRRETLDSKIGDQAEQKRLEQLIAGASIDRRTIDSKKYLEAVAGLRDSLDSQERRFAAFLIRPVGVHGSAKVDRSAITDEVRTKHSQLFEFIKERKLPRTVGDDVLLKILNRQYLLAAQRLRDSAGPNEPLHDYVMKIREWYGPVIQVYDTSEQTLK